VQLVGEPGHPSLLTIKFCLDFPANVYCHEHIAATAASTNYIRYDKYYCAASQYGHDPQFAVQNYD
jgi:hypothetical protein